MRATLKDVAKLAGVSTPLVSLYLNNHPQAARIAEETKRRIADAVRTLNYRPSATARALRKGSSKTVGLILGNITNPYSCHLAQALLDEMESLDYQLFISVSNYDRAKELHCLRNMLDRQPDAILYSLYLYEDAAAAVRRSNCPLIQLESALPQFDSVTISPRAALAAAFEETRRAGGRCAVCTTTAIPSEWNDACAELAGRNGLEFIPVELPGNRIAPEACAEMLRHHGAFVFSFSSRVAAAVMAYAATHGENHGTRFVYSYTLPANYIGTESVFGGIVRPFDDFVKAIVAQVAARLAGDTGEPAHRVCPARFLNPAELQRFYGIQRNFWDMER